MRLFYHAINGSGLGHLMRVSAIAVAVRERDGGVHQLIATSANYPAHLRRLNMPTIILPADDSGPRTGPDRRLGTISGGLANRILADVIAEYKPNVVVFDTYTPGVLARYAASDGRRSVLVLRHCRERYITSRLCEGFFDSFDLVLVPHGREESRALFGPENFEKLSQLPNFRFIGGIAFPAKLDSSGMARMARKYRITENEKVILISVGSGGYGPANKRFVRTAVEAAVRLRQRMTATRVICVGGPYGDADSVPAECDFVDSEADLQLLMARADLVVAHGGYNTIQEVLQTGVRAILVPMHRKTEDQAAFVRYLVDRGRVHALAAIDKEDTYVEAYARALREPRPEPETIEGAAHAAETIFGLVNVVQRFTCGRARTGSTGDFSPAGAVETARAIARGRGRAGVRIEWDLVPAFLAQLGESAASRVEQIELDIGSGDVPTWQERIRANCRALLEAGFDLACITILLYDRSGGNGLAALAPLIKDVAVRAVVAHVPKRVLETRAADLFDAMERCREIATPFKVDITTTENAWPSVDYP